MSLQKKETSRIEKSSYLRCLAKAVSKAESLFCRDSETAGYDEIHAVKSILYVAIERAGIEVEQSTVIQQKLRELLSLVAVWGDASWREREEVMRILESLQEQIFFLIYSRPYV